MAEGYGEEKTALTVPKFSSFKSKDPPEEPEKRHQSRKRRQNEDNESSSHRSARHRSSRRSSHESHRQRGLPESRSRERKATRDAELRSDQRPSTRPSGVPGVFVIDTKGDPLITNYGGIDKAQIPVYHRCGGGRVLGTVGRLVIHRDLARDQFSLRMPGEGSAAFAESNGLRSKRPAIAPSPVMIRGRKVGSSNNVEDGSEGFLSLSSSNKRKRELSDDSTDEDEPPAYRSIQGKARQRQQQSDSELDEDSDLSMDLAMNPQDNPLRWKSIQLSQQVRDNPQDIDAWLELVDHQDTLLKAGEEIDQTVLEDEARSYAEIKVSMLEKALRNTKEVKDRRRVLVYLMREGVKVWNSKTAVKRWAEVLKDEDDDFELWKAHFDFLISNMTAFRYEDVKKVLHDRLRRSLARVEGPSIGAAFAEAIHVFFITTRFVHGAGYKELAVAAWQGLLEFNLFRPPNMDDEQSALEAFQDFWESEVPRIGDAEAKGWRHYVESGGEGDAPEPLMSDIHEPLASRDVFKAWSYSEQWQAQKARMTARTMDEGTQDDPFRVVMFADIEAFLFLIPHSILPEVTEQLMDAFLLFSGLQPAFRSGPWTEKALRDQFLSSPLAEIDLNAVNKADVGETDDGDLGSIERREPRFRAENIRAAVSPCILFGGAKWFRYVMPRRESTLVDIAWVSETLRQVIYMAGQEGLATYYLAIRFSIEPTAIKKTAKSLLKRYPTNYLIYNAYALAEFANNDPNVANKVLASTTGAAPSSAKWHRFLLFKSWSWIELQIGNRKMATLRLCSSVDEALKTSQPDVDEPGRTVILKAQQSFTAEFDESLATGDLEAASTFSECLTLLSYLTAEGNTEPSSVAQGNISTAMSVVEAISRDFASRGLSLSAAHERLLQFAAQLLYFNASSGPFRRVYMREQLSRFITLFPQNTMFLSLFEWSDASLRVIDETRNLIHDQALVKPHDCVSNRVFAISHELTHGNSNTTKTAFEQALSSDVCKNSPTLWISYIRFCQSQKALRSKAKDVFYRALRHCPSSKDVMMEAFVTLVRDLESEELKSVYNTMTLKGMRVHVDLEEFLDKRKRREPRARKS